MNFKEMLLAGNSLPHLDIYDAHGHIDTFGGTVSVNSDPGYIVKTMDEIGIKETVVSSSFAIKTDAFAGNCRVLEAVEKYPGRIKGYVTVNPLHTEGGLPEIIRCKKEGMVGIKFHPSHAGYMPSDPRMEECFKYANENGTIVLVHTYGIAEVADLEKVVCTYPDAKFIFAHSGTSGGYKLTAEIIKKYENAYCDLCMAMPRANMLEYLVEYGNENKILYGTDVPLSDQRIMLGRVLLTDISDSAKVKILGENYVKLFKDAVL